jgi:hypothetical protein
MSIDLNATLIGEKPSDGVLRYAVAEMVSEHGVPEDMCREALLAEWPVEDRFTRLGHWIGRAEERLRTMNAKRQRRASLFYSLSGPFQRPRMVLLSAGGVIVAARRVFVEGLIDLPAVAWTALLGRPKIPRSFFSQRGCVRAKPRLVPRTY